MNVKKVKLRGCGRAHLQSVERLFRDGSVFERAEAYVNGCREVGEGEKPEFPNLAGFGRALGVGLEELHRLGEKYPAVYDAVLAVLEDAALNAGGVPGKSALLAMSYFRRRLGYEAKGGKGMAAEATSEGKQEVRVVFEHDLMEDGR